MSRAPSRYEQIWLSKVVMLCRGAGRDHRGRFHISTLAQAVYLTKFDSEVIHFLYIPSVLWNMMSMLLLALCTSCSLAKSPNILHQYADGEGEITNILQVSPRVSESTFPSIECEQRIGHDDGCSALFNKVSLSRHSQPGVIRSPSSAHFV